MPSELYIPTRQLSWPEQLICIRPDAVHISSHPRQVDIVCFPFSSFHKAHEPLSVLSGEALSAPSCTQVVGQAGHSCCSRPQESVQTDLCRGQLCSLG